MRKQALLSACGHATAFLRRGHAPALGCGRSARGEHGQDAHAAHARSGSLARGVPLRYTSRTQQAWMPACAGMTGRVDDHSSTMPCIKRIEFLGRVRTVCFRESFGADR